MTYCWIGLRLEKPLVSEIMRNEMSSSLSSRKRRPNSAKRRALYYAHEDNHYNKVIDKDEVPDTLRCRVHERGKCRLLLLLHDGLCISVSHLLSAHRDRLACRNLIPFRRSSDGYAMTDKQTYLHNINIHIYILHADEGPTRIHS